MPDRAVWSGIYAISGTLETTLPEVFMPDYASRLDEARQRLLDAMGGEITGMPWCTRIWSEGAEPLRRPEPGSPVLGD
ncbi:hypothetical protein GCM10022285_29670 [Streptomyces tunisiensis]|uniref:Uncharacterized protein n=1 Tax=Streptomyces tunisiensis TaxID=948699 RepID=A0ABP7YFX4_9ACTN